MKKRILALALAGTTAFSVFGAALSANAWDSTDTRYNVDAYKSYTPVANKIVVTAKDATTASFAIDYNNGLNYKFTIDATKSNGDPNQTNQSFKSVNDYIKLKYDVKEEYTAEKGVSFTPSAETVLKSSEYKPVKLVALKNKTTKAIDYVRIVPSSIPSGWSETYELIYLDGTYYIDADAAYNSYGSVTTDDTIYYATTTDGDIVYLNNAKDKETVAEYKVTDKDVPSVSFNADGTIASTNIVTVTDSVNAPGVLYNYAGGTYTYAQLIDEIKADYSAYKQESLAGYVHTTTNAKITAEAYNALKVIDDYDDRIVTDSTTGTDANYTISVTAKTDNGEKTWAENMVAGEAATGVQGYTKWTFNGDMTAEATVEPYRVDTTSTSSSLNITKVEVPTIYAYDFFPAKAPASSASSIAYSWNYESMAKAAAAMGTNTFTAEQGRGVSGMGVRYDVVSDWIDFLDNLAINGDSKGYVESETEFVSNYADMFYTDPIFNIWGEQIGSVNVDLYNIKELLSDIYDLNNSAAYYKANTSELVYLMQQYDKYIGNYIDKSDVNTSEWGELMLSVLNSATADDFKRSADYKKYVNRVEDLQDAYEEATTVGMIKEAEVGMYDLLTSTPYTVSSSADASDLSATLSGLYFNAKSNPATYAVKPSTEGNAAYTNYNYYVAVVNTDANNNPYNFSTTLKAGYYSLYPMADYIDNDTATPNTNYNGNVASDDFNGKYATEEYEWFWNVYQLAVKMSGTNRYQGAVDAINDALTEAVSNLTVTTTPSSTETAAVADTMAKYEGKIDTDYNEGYYAKYTQANDYATNVAEGKWQTRIATMITGVAGEALTYQGTQVTVTKNDMKTVEDAIKNGKTALEAIKADANYNAAQVNALNKAISAAEDLVSLYEGTYSTSKTYQSVNKQYTRLTGDKDQMVKSDLTAAIEAIDSAINYSEIIMDWSKNDAGKWQYGTEEGYLNDGWHKIGKTWFYFNADGTAKQSEWFQENGTWYWFNSNCGAACGWAKVDGSWYYFKGNNAMKTGWEKVDGNWYYMASSGKMVTGWCEVNGKWYYFSKESNSLGQMLYSTTVDGYKLGADGAWIK